MPAQVPLLLVDGHNLLWRAAFGFPAEIRSRDKTRDLTAPFGFFALLRVAIRDELPAAPEVIVVFDGEHGSVERQDSDADYKANRELDDVIATLITHTRHRPAWIFSTDRDYYQLLNEQIRVLNTAMHPGKRHIGPDDVAARYGVGPAQWPSFCALKGDPADNIPGVRSIGAATAARLLDGGLSLDDLPASGRLTGAKGKLVGQQWQQVLAWRDLIRMRTDLPLPLEPTGDAGGELPKPAEVIEKLELW